MAQGPAEKSEKNISSSFETWSEIKGCYRFFNNEKVTCSRILQPHRMRTLKRIREHKRVLFIQDTVVLSYGKEAKCYRICILWVGLRELGRFICNRRWIVIIL